MRKKITIIFVLTAIINIANAMDQYTYDGSLDTYGPTNSWDSLDGTWDRDNNVDLWDGSGIGSGVPGGYDSMIEGARTFLRVQDTGDPSVYGICGSIDNGKLGMNHLLGNASTNILDDGVMLSFGLRIATATSPIDPQYPANGSGGGNPWPTNGVGIGVVYGGKSMISVVHQPSASAVQRIAFGLVHASEVIGNGGFTGLVGTEDILVMNNLAGTVPSDAVGTSNTSGFTARNYVVLGDATVWNDIDVLINTGGAGTHQVMVWVNGLFKGTFDVTAGNTYDENVREYNGSNMLAINAGGTVLMGAYDIDYITIASTSANTPDPEIGETRVALDLSDRAIPDNLSWMPPDNSNITILSYDLYLDPNETKVINREAGCLIKATGLPSPQYNPVADFDFSETYFWAVDTFYQISGDPTIYVSSVTNPWYFQAISAAPEVDAGSDIITALPLLPAIMAGTVTDATGDVIDITWDIISYPGDPVNAVAQMKDQSGYLAGLAEPDLLRDWIGSDTRSTGDPLVLTLSGLPAGIYVWNSYHHDPIDQTGLFDVSIYDANGERTITDIDITDGNTIADPQDYTKLQILNVVSDGSDIVLAFHQQVSSPIEQAFFVMNGFDLYGVSETLSIDFGQPISPVMAGYQAWTAEHEVLSTFVPQDFSVFGTTVTISVNWGPAALKQINAVITQTNSDLYAPTAELATDMAGTYRIRLTATDADDNESSDTVLVFVGADACQAAQETPGWTGFNHYDRDEDCDVDLSDFAQFALEWLDDRNLTSQQ